MAQAQRGRANMSVPKTTRDNRVIITGQTDYTVQCCHGLHTAHQQHQRNTLRQLNSLSDISQLFFFELGNGFRVCQELRSRDKLEKR